MRSIGLLAQKGGTGKTTLTVHLAVLAQDALVVDLDPQQSAVEWWQARGEDLPELAVGRAADLEKAVRAGDRAYVFVDTPPHAAEDARTVAGIVDLVIIPTRPAILDLRAIRATVEIVRAARATAVIVINACPPGRAKLVAEAREVLGAYGLPIAPVAVTQRAAFSDALNDGRAVTEFEPNGKAADELRELWRWIDGQASAARPR